MPAYEAAGTVGSVVRAVTPLVDEVVVVDDGSTDGTALQAKDEGAVVVSHPRNLGKGAALRTGFEVCLRRGCRWILTLDADGQHDPAEVDLFLTEAASEKWDMVVGSRMGARGPMPPVRVVTNFLTSFVVSLLAGQFVPDSQCGYRIISRDVLARVPLRCSAYDLETEIIVKTVRAGYRVGWVAVSSRYGAGESYIQPVWDTIRFVVLALRLAVGN